MFLFSSVVAVPLEVRNPRKARPVEVSPPAVDVEVGVRFLLPAFERIRVAVRAGVSSHAEPDGEYGP